MGKTSYTALLSVLLGITSDAGSMTAAYALELLTKPYYL